MEIKPKPKERIRIVANSQASGNAVNNDNIHGGHVTLAILLFAIAIFLFGCPSIAVGHG